MTGSMARTTAIKRYSDVDVIVILDLPSAQRPTVDYALDLLIRLLRTAGYEAKISGAAVSVSFVNGYGIDFMPAFDRKGADGGLCDFDIPRNDRKGWLRYSPDDQTRRTSSAVKICGPDFKKLVRAVKWWARIHGHQVASYELELIACETFVKELPELPQAIARFFQSATLRLGAQVSIKAPGLKDASSVARRACELQEIGDIVGSASLWRRIFGEQFPIVVCRDHLHS